MSWPHLATWAAFRVGSPVPDSPTLYTNLATGEATAPVNGSRVTCCRPWLTAAAAVTDP